MNHEINEKTGFPTTTHCFICWSSSSYYWAIYWFGYKIPLYQANAVCDTVSILADDTNSNDTNKQQ